MPPAVSQDEHQQATRASARSAGLTVLTQVWSALVGLGMVVILTRVLSKEDIGRFALLLGAQEVLNLLFGLGIPASLLHFIPAHGRQRGRRIGLSSALLMTGVSSGLGALIFLAAPALGGLFEDAPGGSFEGLLRWLSLYIALSLPASMVPSYLIATDRASGALGFSLVQQGVRLVAVLVPALLGMPIDRIVIWLACSGVVAFAWLWVLLLGVERHRPGGFDFGLLRAQLAYGLPQAGSVGVQRFNRWVDKYTVGLLMPFDAVGVYTNCSRELPVVRDIPNGATTGMIPELTRRYTRGDTEGFLSLWRGLMTKVSLIAFPAFAFTFTAAGELIELLFTAEYLGGLWLMRIYLLVLPLRLCIYGGVLRAMGDTKTFLRSIAVATGVNLVLNYPLFLLWGWYGPAIATLVSELLTIALLVGKSAEYLQVTVLRVFPLAPLARTAVAAALPCIPCVWAVHTDLPAAMRLLLAAACYLLTFLICSRALRVLGASDFRYLGSLVGLGPRR